MKFLIAGLGSIGRRHLHNLVTLGEKDIILYRTGKSTIPEEELAGFASYNDYQQALDAKPDAVIVSNPTALHLDIAIPAADSGIHLLLEKPVSHSKMRIEELIKAVNKNAVKVLVGFQFRFHPTLIQMKKILSAGEIGEVVSARAHWGEFLPNWHPWEDYRNSYAARPDLGGGVVLTLCHPFDYLRWLIGEVESLWAFTSESAALPTGSESIAEVGVTFSNNATGSIHLDYLQQPGSHTLDVIGTKGSLRWDNSTGELKCFQSSTNKWTSFFPAEGFERNWLFIEEMKSFLSLQRGETTSPCTLDDGIIALDIALAIHRSAAEKSLMKLGR